MNFIGSGAYYILCAIALAVLIFLLIRSYKRGNTPKRSSSPPPEGKHIPKYAAGGEMDRINRNSYIAPPEKRSNIAALLIILLIVAAIAIPTWRNRANMRPTMFPSASSTSVLTPASYTGKQLKMEITSLDWSYDQTKIFVTCAYSNETDIHFYAVTTRLDLQDENDSIVQSETTDVIEDIGPNEKKEITTAVTINPENIGKVRRIKGHVSYRYDRQ